MATFQWVEPEHDLAAVDRAGDVFRQRGQRSVDELVRAYQVMDNWRASHAFPLNTFQVVLRNRARELDRASLVAQRLKRVGSILRKLRSHRTMRLSQMQDIGGCRGVVQTLAELGELQNLYLKRRTAADLVNSKDYVAEPRESGYRSIHLIYRYRTSRRTERSVFNGHIVEVQLRTQIQHAWATAVETVGTIIGQALKSSEGPDEWLKLMRQVSSLFAYYEGTPPLRNADGPAQLAKEVKAAALKLRMFERLQAFGNALQLLQNQRNPNDQYFLLRLDPDSESLEIRGFPAGAIEQATQQYNFMEQEAGESRIDIVLVRADSIDALRRAYPNYFMDTKFFVSFVQGLIS